MSINKNISRREMLRMAGAASVATAFAGCVPDQTESVDAARTSIQKVSQSQSRSSVPSCIVRPEQMEGPYFVDNVLKRSDIRLDPSDGSMTEGIPLRLTINVSRMNGSACEPLPGAVVDLWQCDALGVYSDFQDFAGHFDTRGRKFLRGHQETDAAGTAEFTTIYPGWYPGRAVHIHFKIRTDPDSEQGHEFTSQLYFDDELTAQVHTREPYSSHGAPPEKNADDGIFRRGGDELMLDLAEDDDGYIATFGIGLQI
jgi:protocatechuate 3,4-dioxygenase beta subunit